MEAAKSAIVIGLVLALLVPVSVVGQEASPSPVPSVEPVPSAEPPAAESTFVPKSFYAVLDNEGEAPAAAVLRESISRAYAESPDAAAAEVLSLSQALACFDAMEASEECALLDRFWVIYKTTGDEAFFDLSVGIFNLGIKVGAENMGWAPADSREAGLRERVREELRREYGEAGPSLDEDTEVAPSPRPTVEASAVPQGVIDGPDSSTEAASPTPKTANDLIGRKHPSVTVSAFEKAYYSMVKDPATPVEFSGGGPESRQAFRLCREAPEEVRRYAECLNLLGSSVWVHTSTGSATSWEAAQKGYDYLYNTYKEQRKNLNEFVRIFFEA